MSEESSILTLKAVDAGYGKKQVLFGVDLQINRGEITAIIGPNGAGKSTVLNVIHGILPIWSGSVTFDGIPMEAKSTLRRVRKGITFCPQGERVFCELTVRENLRIGSSHLQSKEAAGRIADVLDLLPPLVPRLRQKAGTLSGGEQQMVAIARALVSKPKLLMLDEPSLGLSPDISDDVFGTIVELNRTQGVTILIIEQKVRKVLKIANHVLSLKLGRVSYSGSPARLAGDIETLRSLFI